MTPYEPRSLVLSGPVIESLSQRYEVRLIFSEKLKCELVRSAWSLEASKAINNNKRKCHCHLFLGITKVTLLGNVFQSCSLSVALCRSRFYRFVLVLQ